MPNATIIHGAAQHLPLADCSVDAIVCDPPYELGFMSKKWDSTGVAYDVATWREALRVLKPGGHLLAFGGMRTQHRLICAIEDAGFDIRDAIIWHFGSGFPKSLDVSKAIDRQRDDSASRRGVGAWLRAQREARGLRQKDVAAYWPSATGGLTGCVANWEHGFNLPTWDQWLQLREIVGFGAEMDAEVWRLNGRKGTPGEAWQTAEVLAVDKRYNEPSGIVNVGQGERELIARQIKAANTDDARRWQGWGTALKPASEIICVARKPLAAGTVAANVLQWGCGALNVDGCRVATNAPIAAHHGTRNPRTAMGDGWHNAYEPGDAGKIVQTAGRWPTNVVLSHVGLTDGDGDIIGDACADGCVPQCPVAELDRQSGFSTSPAAGSVLTTRGRRAGVLAEAGGMHTPGREFRAAESYAHGDSGGASRFFPTFRYQAKAPARERPKVNGVAHPTVKPLGLMRWLVRLVGGQPGSTILDMFAGSGATLEAALLEGFNAIGVERSAEYLPLIRHRIDRATAATQPAPDDVAELTLFDVA